QRALNIGAVGVAVDKGYLYFGARGKWHVEVIGAGGWAGQSHPVAGARVAFAEHKIKHHTIQALLVTLGDHAMAVFAAFFKAGCVYAGGGGYYPRTQLLTVSRTILVIC